MNKITPEDERKARDIYHKIMSHEAISVDVFSNSGLRQEEHGKLIAQALADQREADSKIAHSFCCRQLNCVPCEIAKAILEGSSR